MADTYEAFYNGKPLNPNRGLPTMTYAQAEDCGLTESERIWCRTDGEDTPITADDIPYSTGVSVKDKIDELGDKIGNSKIYNYFNAPLTFVVDLPFTPSSSIGGSALIYNGNQGYCGLIRVDSTPTITRIIGNAELSVSISGSKLTITSNNRLWGSTSIILNWN